MRSACLISGRAHHCRQLLPLAALLMMLIPATASAGNDWLHNGERLLGGYMHSASSARLSDRDIGKAFREALSIGTGKVVHQLGRGNGFYKDRAVHIPLPRELNKVRNVLKSIGQSRLLDDLELKLNRAAEAATPKAKRLFLQAIRGMSFADVRRIYRGPDDAATRYFERHTGAQLAREMKPIVRQALAGAGALRAYERVMGRYRSLPFVPDVRAKLDDYVVRKGMQGIFHYLAREEAAIRHHPARQTTRLLKEVFGRH